MDGKYIIILLFIFLVFLMGSINSTVTNNFYNNTTGSQDHAVLSNLSYASSNHTGFQSSDTLNTDVSALGYITNITGNFIRKTGDSFDNHNSTLDMNFSKINNATHVFLGGQGNNYNPIEFDGNYSPMVDMVGYDMKEWHTNMMAFSNGIYWNESCGSNDGFDGIYGYCWDTYPKYKNGRAAMSFQFVNGAFNYYYWEKDLNLSLYNINGGTNFSNGYIGIMAFSKTGLKINNGNMTVTALAGAGNAYVCVDTTGKQYRGTPTC